MLSSSVSPCREPNRQVNEPASLGFAAVLEALSPRIRVLIALPFAVALIVGCGSSDDTGSATSWSR